MQPISLAVLLQRWHSQGACRGYNPAMTTSDFFAGNADLPVTLDNCADEPIHIPGSIQPHGAILVFGSAAQLVSWSVNAPALLQWSAPPVLLAALDELGLDADVVEKIRACLQELEDGEAPASMLETMVGAQDFDCIVHGHEGLVIVEYECRAREAASVATLRSRPIPPSNGSNGKNRWRRCSPRRSIKSARSPASTA